MRAADDFTAHEIGHDRDPADNASSYVLLDDGELHVTACPVCKRDGCICCTHGPGCDCDLPISQREFRALAAKHGEGPARWRR